jgi:hypothetical protein
MLSTEAESSVDEQSVFLNVPFDPEYNSLFLALIAGIAGIGRTPRCVLEVPSGGRNRLERIFDLISNCGSSIHDLSRVTPSGALSVPRFNMPFELGMTYALSQMTSRHSFFVLEEKAFRLQASLSDLNGHDPHIHGGSQAGVLRCVLDCFGRPSGSPSLSDLQGVTKGLQRLAAKFQKEQGVESVFHPHVFRQIVTAAGRLAWLRRLIR